MDNSLIGEIALRCNDVSFKDFAKSVYEKCFLRSSRKVARRYGLIQRISDFKVTIPNYDNLTDDEKTEKVSENVNVDLPSFTSEYMVKVNDYEYTKVKRVNRNEYEYVLYRDENKIWFNYSPRTGDDTIELRYVSDINIDDYDIEEIQPVIPSEYNEELISLACVEVAKLGIVKFNESSEGGKYSNILKLYALDERDLNKNLIKDDAWVEMKVWRVY